MSEKEEGVWEPLGFLATKEGELVPGAQLANAGREQGLQGRSHTGPWAHTLRCRQQAEPLVRNLAVQTRSSEGQAGLETEMPVDREPQSLRHLVNKYLFSLEKIC